MVHASEHTNKLINEKSPYLLQHAYNPVDWYPWNEEAFEIAKEKNKPVFLSIGYSTCHWWQTAYYNQFGEKRVQRLYAEPVRYPFYRFLNNFNSIFTLPPGSNEALEDD